MDISSACLHQLLVYNWMHMAFAMVRVYFIAIIVISGILLGSRKTYLNVWMVYAATVVFGSLLKEWFKIELFTPWGYGYGFPSTHMQALTAAWGYWLLRQKKLWLVILWLIVLTLTMPSVVYFECHTWTCVWGGVLFGMAELPVIFWLEKNNRLKQGLFVWVMCCAVLWLMCSNVQTHLMPPLACFMGVFIGIRSAYAVKQWMGIGAILIVCIWLSDVIKSSSIDYYLGLASIAFILTCLPNFKLLKHYK